MKFNKWLAVIAGILMTTLLLPSQSTATNGYFSHGYGMRYKMMAGAGTAVAFGPTVACTNPGGMAFVSTQYQIELSLFNPVRQYSITGAPSGMPQTFGLTPGTIESDTPVFYIPSFAATWEWSSSLKFGLSAFGNGGMNTDYPAQTFYGTSPTGVDLAQLFLAPTLSYNLDDMHGFGITPILGYQRFEAKGLQAFGNFSSDANALTNNEYDTALGYGVRVGYMGRWSNGLHLGASWQSKIYMETMEDYAGLFAEEGDFDVPSSWNVGIGYSYDRFLIVADVQQIRYSDVPAVSNSMMPNLMSTALGQDNAAGFGWEDMTIFKTGMAYDVNTAWTFRGGYSYGEQPIPQSEVLFNILAPGVIEQHLSFGFTHSLKNGPAIDFAVSHGFSNSVTGNNAMEMPGQQSIELKMHQWEFAVGLTF